MTAQLVQTKKRINIELSGMVIKKLDSLARKADCSRSQLIRNLICESLAEKERTEIELAMKEGYSANYDFIKESSEEWNFTSEDGI